MKTPARDTELSKWLTQGLSEFKTNVLSTGPQSFCQQEGICSLQWKFNILSITESVSEEGQGIQAGCFSFVGHHERRGGLSLCWGEPGDPLYRWRK